MKKVTIDLTDCKYLMELHERIRIALDFPKGYGNNWDAFWDFIHRECTYDYIIVKGSNTVSKDLVGSIKMMKDILEENKQYYQNSNHPVDYEFID